MRILGVVIGVAAVIILMSVGKRTTARIISNLSSLGTNLVYVQPGSTTQGGVRQGFGSATTLTLEDAEAIASDISNITAVAPYSTVGTQVIVGSENMMVRITGVTTDYLQIFNVEVAEEDFFSQYQYDRNAKVAVIGPDVSSTFLVKTTLSARK